MRITILGLFQQYFSLELKNIRKNSNITYFDKLTNTIKEKGQIHPNFNSSEKFIWGKDLSVQIPDR